MNSTGIRTLVISIYEKYSVVLFEGAVQLSFSKAEVKHFRRGVLFEGAAQIEYTWYMFPLSYRPVTGLLPFNYCYNICLIGTVTGHLQ